MDQNHQPQADEAAQKPDLDHDDRPDTTASPYHFQSLTYQRNGAAKTRRHPPKASVHYEPPQYLHGAPQPQQPEQVPFPFYPPPGYRQRSRLATALLALILGTLGVHEFYLGFTTKGIIHVLLCVFIVTIPVSFVWGFLEAVQYFIGNENHNYDGNGVLLGD